MLDLYQNRRTKMSEQTSLTNRDFDFPIQNFEFPYHNEYYANLLWRENERFLEYQFQARSPQVLSCFTF